jgi:hypothetical protein
VKRVALLVAIGVALVAYPALAQPHLPEDVARFIERRDACDHFRGEEPYDAERREFLAQQTRALCVGTDAQLAKLKEKYRRDKTVATRLDEYEPRIEAASPK